MRDAGCRGVANPAATAPSEANGRPAVAEPQRGEEQVPAAACTPTSSLVVALTNLTEANAPRNPPVMPVPRLANCAFRRYRGHIRDRGRSRSRSDSHGRRHGSGRNRRWPTPPDSAPASVPAPGPASCSSYCGILSPHDTQTPPESRWRPGARSCTGPERRALPPPTGKRRPPAAQRIRSRLRAQS